jgi:uncharacterized protein YggT (Ycf19 family)
MWETINSIFTILFKVYPIFSIIAGSIILLFMGFMSYMTKIYMTKYKDSNIKNKIMKEYLLAHLIFKEQIHQIDNLSYKIKEVMNKCYHRAFRDTTKYQDDLFDLLTNTLMNNVRKAIINSLKEPDFFIYNSSNSIESQKYEEKVKNRIAMTKAIVDDSFRDSLPDFIEGLDFSRLIVVLLSEGVDDIYKILYQMFSICKDIYNEYSNNDIDQKLFDSIKSHR